QPQAALFDKSNQAFPGHNLIHFDEKALATGLLTFPGVFGRRRRTSVSSERFGERCWGILPNQETFFRVSLNNYSSLNGQ
ncbi:hypothetical protein, partial [Pseudomonas syringae group genomosp. 3]|uniref:hypothetical protein n=1 Tax=Pseudomonas syringae group genomosp. 3 TaxID=251701 RepID=UPI001E3356D1